MDWQIGCVAGTVAIIGALVVFRDFRRRRTRSRGYDFGRSSEPKRYWFVMAFNCAAVGLLAAGAVISIGEAVLRQISN